MNEYTPCPNCGGERTRTSLNIANPYCYTCAENEEKRLKAELLTLLRDRSLEERIADLEKAYVDQMSTHDVYMHTRILKYGEENWWNDQPEEGKE